MKLKCCKLRDVDFCFILMFLSCIIMPTTILYVLFHSQSPLTTFFSGFLLFSLLFNIQIILVQYIHHIYISPITRICSEMATQL